VEKQIYPVVKTVQAGWHVGSSKEKIITIFVSNNRCPKLMIYLAISLNVGWYFV